MDSGEAVSLSRSSEGHARRASPMPDPDQPTIRERVLLDLAVHAGAFAYEIAERLELPRVRVSVELLRAGMAGLVDRGGRRGFPQYALHGVPFEVRTPNRGRHVARKVDPRIPRMERQIAAVAEYASSLKSRGVSVADVAVRFRMDRRLAERRVLQCRERGLLVPVRRNGAPTGRYRTPRPEDLLLVEDIDPGAPPSPGDCGGHGR